MARTNDAADKGEKNKDGSTTESVADVQTEGVQETLLASVTTAEGSIKFDDLTFQAGTDQFFRFQDLAEGRISEEKILGMINVMAERTRRNREEEIK